MRFTTSRYKYKSAYWHQIDELVPGTMASLEAKFVAPNRIEVSASELDAFTLRLAGHPKFNANRPVEVVIDGKTITVQGSQPLSLAKQQGVWAMVQPQTSPQLKHVGAEGPISDAIAGRHTYVYGTADNPAPEVLQTRREQADHAANWSVDRGPFLRRVMVFPRVLADKEVRASDLETSNLVLFGTKETNSIVAKFSAQLPMHFNAGEAGHGLVYIYPVGEHYLLINSGLPWWSAAQEGSAPANPSRRRGFRPIFGPPGMLMDWQDFLLFKDSADHVIAEGRFDRNWSIPELEAGRMTASGAVTIMPASAKAQN